MSEQAQPPADLRARVRESLRAEIAEVAFNVFAERGFEQTTAAEAAAAAGISRASFFRYFSSKEEAVFAAQEQTGHQIAAAVAARPPSEGIWTALHRAFHDAIESILEDPKTTLERVQLTRQAPSLRAHELERQAAWRGLICVALGERLGREPSDLELRVLAGAAMVVLDVAARRWGESEGKLDFIGLLDAGFDAVAGAAAD